MKNKLAGNILLFMRRHKMITSINVIGYATGLACCFCILLYIFYEAGYDRFHEAYGQISRVTATGKIESNPFKSATTPVILADMVRKKYPTLLLARVASQSVQVAAAPSKMDKVHEFVFADQSIFSVFSFDFVAGNSVDVLNDSLSVVISVSSAERIFGSPARAMNQSLRVDNKLSLRIAGVYRDWPAQSHLKMDMITTFANFPRMGGSESVTRFISSDWLFDPVTTYVKSDMDRKALEDIFNDVRSEHADERVKKHVTYQLQPLKDIHLFSQFYGSAPPQIIYLAIFGLIAALLLFVSAFNFVNLFMVSMLTRLKEISIRKIIGISNKEILFDILKASFTYTSVAFVLSIAIFYAILPNWKMIIGKPLAAGIRDQIILWSGFYCLVLIIAAITALIPATSLIKTDPLTGVNDHIKLQRTGVPRFIQNFVVALFIAAAALFVFMLTVKNQIVLLENRPLGFDQKGLVIVPMFPGSLHNIFGGVDQQLRNDINRFKSEIESSSIINCSTISSTIPGGSYTLGLIKTENVTEKQNLFMSVLSVDYDFMKTYKIPIFAGRDFSKVSGTDHLDAFIVNVSASKMLGFAESHQALGQSIDVIGKKGRIIGVVPDFHFENFLEREKPLIMDVFVSRFSYFSIRLNEHADTTQALSFIRNKWQSVFPDRYFEYGFLEAGLQKSMDGSYTLSRITKLFCLVTLTLAVFGLFGISAFVARAFIKETSLRKIAGATPWDIILLLMGRQGRIIVYAILVGFPMGYWISKLWLSQFSSQTPIHWKEFFVTYFALSVLLLISSCFHIISAARLSPLRIIQRV